MIRTWSFVAYLALVLERLSQAVKPHPAPPLAQLRKYDLGRTQLTLEQPYHPAKAPGGFILIPKDRYFHDSEDILEHI
ncbi:MULTISPECIES: hypothetical protein [unclassified Meiothermus]|uniref:hypothetical protein n=1 Tax=unclassified Meiothermus TaxID=370471 RepID=UPI000D7CD0B3|nr:MULTISPECIES: hypothetical protein [unclassified Meiothermus]PZA08539.1 hypothetical protein DNA98_00365 [Meiothermus sp. Pnk-1]RYM40843.1 hypothetical protein EWH23_01575 [Meiothermus sp. PNK-Is4]